MTKTYIFGIESVVFILFGAGVGAFFAIQMGHKPQIQNNIALPVMQSFPPVNSLPIVNANPTITIAPSLKPTQKPTTNPILSPALPKPQLTTQTSPDGTVEVIMTVMTNNDGSRTYLFNTSNADGSNQHQIYTATYTQDTMSIPFNAWSPNDKYVFLTHTSSTGAEAIVFNADGTPLTSTDQSINAKLLFEALDNGKNYKETTGWASDTLLVINSTLADGTSGPSYWLEIPSKAIIPLATKFE